MKPWHFATGYLVGAWLTFGHTSTLWGQSLPGGPNPRAEWGMIESLFAAWLWPIYWFCKTAMACFS